MYPVKFYLSNWKTYRMWNRRQALVGCKVFLPEDMQEKLPEGEYYWRDIIGLDVYNEDDKYIGKIESIFPTGSNDVYVCKRRKRDTSSCYCRCNPENRFKSPCHDSKIAGRAVKSD